MGWANRITVLRAILTVVVWVMLLIEAPSPAPAMWWIAALAFIVTAATDAVDGWVARHYGDVSVFGRIADPLVDKLLVLGTMVVLLSLDGVPAVLPAWAVLVMLAREMIVTALRGAVEGKGISFQALPLGKLKMVLQCAAVVGVLTWGAGWSLARWQLPLLGPAWNIPHLLVWLSALLTGISGLDYMVRAARILSR